MMESTHRAIGTPGQARQQEAFTARSAVLRSTRNIGRVMVIAPHFEEYAYLMARGLAEKRDVMLVLDTDILTSEYRGRSFPAAPRVTLRPNKFRSFPDFLRLLGHILRFRPHVIHWQEPCGLVKAVMAAIVVILCRPFITLALTIHDPLPHSGRDALIARRPAPFLRYIRRRVHRVFIHGPSCRDQYLSQYLPAPHRDDRVVLTEHGVILSADSDRPPSADFHALMFGRMERYKGLEVLCQAIEHLASEGREAPVHLAGAGPELDALEGRFRACRGVLVQNGFAAAADLIAMIQSTDCVLLPYTSATQSGVLAAAFANGRFVIASRVGGIVDIVEDGVNGILVEPGDPIALACALRSVASDAHLRRRLREGAKRTATEQLSWSRIASDLVSCY